MRSSSVYGNYTFCMPLVSHHEQLEITRYACIYVCSLYRFTCIIPRQMEVIYSLCPSKNILLEIVWWFPMQTKIWVDVAFCNYVNLSHKIERDQQTLDLWVKSSKLETLVNWRKQGFIVEIVNNLVMRLDGHIIILHWPTEPWNNIAELQHFGQTSHGKSATTNQIVKSWCVLCWTQEVWISKKASEEISASSLTQLLLQLTPLQALVRSFYTS